MGQVSQLNHAYDKERSRLSKLFADAKLYKTSKEYRELLEFVARMKPFAPFNAMLLHVQKPGLTYAASPQHWRRRFRRTIRDGARPLIILKPFCPVGLVYDVMDTEGELLPLDVAVFPSVGDMDERQMAAFQSALGGGPIEWYELDAGDGSAGWIKVMRASAPEERGHYRLALNRNHCPATRFTTLAHELAHLFLGHLGKDQKLGIHDRASLSFARRELEAESVAFLVCERNGVAARSETYLSKILEDEDATISLDLYQIMRAAGQVESILGIRERNGRQ